jgi:ATP-dependent exoDNAse (exonuclease V) alpha subunit
MKYLTILAFLFPLTNFAQDQLLDSVYMHLDQNKKIISEGMSFGSRKKVLKQLKKRNQQMVELIEQLDIQIQKKDEQIADLSREKVCTLTIFRQEYVGISNRIEVAKRKAYLECAKKYDMNLQCKTGNLKCE